MDSVVSTFEGHYRPFSRDPLGDADSSLDGISAGDGPENLSLGLYYGREQRVNPLQERDACFAWDLEGVPYLPQLASDGFLDVGVPVPEVEDGDAAHPIDVEVSVDVLYGRPVCGIDGKRERLRVDDGPGLQLRLLRVELSGLWTAWVDHYQ